MAGKNSKLTFERALEALRAHGFEVAAYPAVAGGTLVTKYGVGAVIVAGDAETPVALAVHPGALVRGEVARLLDRGYQKFLKTAQYELPATASALHAIHTFNEDLRQLTGADSLFNESMGTTSDRYQYDRVQGRAGAIPPGTRPWETAASH